MVRELPLNPLWKKRGCTFKKERDWRVPVFFESPDADYRKAVERCGISDLSFRGKIELRGEDRIFFLHNLLTNDIRSLVPGDGCRAMLLHATGKILADMNVSIFEDSVLLDTEMGLEKKLLSLLDRYLITEDVQLSDRTEAYVHLSLQGPEAALLLKNIFQAQLPDRPFQHAPFALDSVPIILVCLTDKTKREYQLLIPKEKAVGAIEKILAAGKEKGLYPVGYETAEILRIERGELRYGWDMGEDILLPETGLEEVAASETKGCYPGQEVVARIRTYKGLKRKMAGLETMVPGTAVTGSRNLSRNVPGTLAAGDKIYAGGKEIGWVTSSAVSPKLQKGIALGYLEKGFWDPGREVLIKSGSRKISARTTVLPFVITGTRYVT